ncbi:Axial regulator YABBY 4-like protein [Drosera capensis]
MATLNQLFDIQEQICYVQCSFCATILLVSVPYSSMSMVVTVRCGHCTGLLSVNMLKAPFVPLHLFTSLTNQDEAKFKEEVCQNESGMDSHSTSLVASSDHDEEDDLIKANHVVNKPPEKKKRAPSAYNQFIKEEIKRLKTLHPNMPHKDAFSAAAKNWAHLRSTQHEFDEENCNCEIEKDMEMSDDTEVISNFKSLSYFCSYTICENFRK